MKGGQALASPVVFAGAALLLLVGALTVSALCSERRRIAGLGGAWFLIFMLPVSNIVPMMQYMAERFLYLPLVGGVLAAADCLEAAPRRRIAMGLAIVCVSLWAATAWTRSSIWKDELTLFVRSHSENPGIARVDQNAISAILRQPHMQRVFLNVRRPGLLPTLDLAPRIELARADWPRVLETARQLESLFPDSPFASEAAGLIFALAGRPGEGVLALERAAATDSGSRTVWRNLGGAYFNNGQFDRAIPALERSLQLDPDNVVVLQTLGAAYRRQGDFLHAADVYEKLTKLEPDNPSNVRWLEESRAKITPPRAEASR
jgi:tetratricopeptide (TPR) repeat protein